MHANMEQWSEIRRRVLTGEMSKREACRRYGIHWLTLKKMLEHEEPPGYRRVKPPRRPTIEPMLPVIRQILEENAKPPKKQRHTAHRIWQRLKAEHLFTGCYTVVKDAVREITRGRKVSVQRKAFLRGVVASGFSEPRGNFDGDAAA